MIGYPKITALVIVVGFGLAPSCLGSGGPGWFPAALLGFVMLMDAFLAAEGAAERKGSAISTPSMVDDWGQVGRWFRALSWPSVFPFYVVLAAIVFCSHPSRSQSAMLPTTGGMCGGTCGKAPAFSVAAEVHEPKGCGHGCGTGASCGAGSCGSGSKGGCGSGCGKTVAAPSAVKGESPIVANGRGVALTAPVAAPPQRSAGQPARGILPTAITPSRSVFPLPATGATGATASRVPPLLAAPKESARIMHMPRAPTVPASAPSLTPAMPEAKSLTR
jgi:hypothetical protein